MLRLGLKIPKRTGWPKGKSKVKSGVAMFDPLTGTKRCSTCGHDLLIREFGKNRRQPDGYQNACNICRNGYWNRWYQELRASPDGQALLRSQWKEISLRESLKR